MNKTVKSLLLVLCAVVLFAAGIFATLAYLQDDTGEAVNTISIGDVKIDLDETKVNEYGVAVDEHGNVLEEGEEEVRVITEQHYTLVPGMTYIKDPIIHVEAGSEPAYLFVRVDNPISDVLDNPNIEAQMAANGWLAIDADKGFYVYAKNGDGKAVKVDAKNYTESDYLDVPVFQSISVSADETYDTLKHHDKEPKPQIKVKAFAIQAYGLDTINDGEIVNATALAAADGALYPVVTP